VRGDAVDGRDGWPPSARLLVSEEQRADPDHGHRGTLAAGSQSLAAQPRVIGIDRRPCRRCRRHRPPSIDLRRRPAEESSERDLTRHPPRHHPQLPCAAEQLHAKNSSAPRRCCVTLASTTSRSSCCFERDVYGRATEQPFIDEDSPSWRANASRRSARSSRRSHGAVFLLRHHDIETVSCGRCSSSAERAQRAVKYFRLRVVRRSGLRPMVQLSTRMICCA